MSAEVLALVPVHLGQYVAERLVVVIDGSEVGREPVRLWVESLGVPHRRNEELLGAFDEAGVFSPEAELQAQP